MIEVISKAMQEVSKQDIVKGQSDVPAFAKDMKPEIVTSYEEANLPIQRFVDTKNQSLDGDMHPITGIPFESKIVEMTEGELVEGVFPEFPNEFEMQLDESQYLESDARQFNAARDELKNEVASNPELADKFTSEQLEQIEFGETPDGYVWHHSEQPGVLQLVDSEIHAKTGHTGGRSIWGGGSDNR